MYPKAFIIALEGYNQCIDYKFIILWFKKSWYITQCEKWKAIPFALSLNHLHRSVTSSSPGMFSGKNKSKLISSAPTVWNWTKKPEAAADWAHFAAESTAFAFRVLELSAGLLCKKSTVHRSAPRLINRGGVTRLQLHSRVMALGARTVNCWRPGCWGGVWVL